MFWFGGAFNKEAYSTDYDDSTSQMDAEYKKIFIMMANDLRAKNFPCDSNILQIGRDFPNCIHVYDLSTEKWNIIGSRK